jgi:3-hydroxyisobutyrate dehydrogenase-like beta-hydroxyacid dehydrogenase
MNPTVGFIGLGLMGGPMAKNLAKAGFPLIVWNRTREKAEGFVRDSAGPDVKVGASPRETAAKADFLITIVSDPPALEEVLWGQNGAIDGLRRGSTYIDSSTVSTDLVRKIGKTCKERGVGFLDAPVTGGTWGAEKGELVFMVGGEQEALERAKPVLETLGKRIFFWGQTVRAKQ